MRGKSFHVFAEGFQRRTFQMIQILHLPGDPSPVPKQQRRINAADFLPQTLVRYFSIRHVNANSRQRFCYQA